MALTQSQFLEAASLRPVTSTPIWLMRQAGRYMPEYRRIRERYSLLEICELPELACEVTLQPIRAFEMDAAIVFADILLPLIPLGLELHFVPNRGPVIDNPIHGTEDVERLRPLDVEADLASVLETIRLVRAELEGAVPVIGFAGAPFTVAAYAIEGGSSRTFVNTKRMMYRLPEAWDDLMKRIEVVTGDYLAAQVNAGAQAIQLFDSWVGVLGIDDYRRNVMPYMQRLFARLEALDVPVIHFGVNTNHMLESLCEAGGDVIGVDWRLPIDRGWSRIGKSRAIQGNLDPAALFAPRAELLRRASDILNRVAGRPGHIFNLGHGVLPDTPVDNVKALVDFVHDWQPAAT